MTDDITTDGLLDQGEQRTGLLRNQLLMMVAKSAAVRHVATSASGGDRFVLKGGTLLTNVYRSSRQSIADADYLHLDRDGVKTDDIEAALRFDEGTFSMEPSMSYVDQSQSFVGVSEFRFDSFAISRLKERKLKITVSVRRGERMDPPPVPLIYVDDMLAGQSTFEVQGLTINELSAEKILAWCSKDLAKHLVDLAYVAREREKDVDHERVAELVRDKFKLEAIGPGRYRQLGIRNVSQLAARFTNTSRHDALLHREWERLQGDQLFFLPSEQSQPDDQQLLRSENVVRLATEFWAPTFDQLSASS